MYNNNLRMSEKKTDKNRGERFCSICNYTANRTSDLTKHIKTQKHIKKSIMNVNLEKIRKKTEQ